VLPKQSRAAEAKRESQAIEMLESFVTPLGLAAVMGLLAEIASRRAEVLLLAGEDLKAAVWTHDAEALDRAARTLDGE